MTQPVGFAEFGEAFLSKKFYTKQKELLDACKFGGYVVGRFNNSGGKTREVLATLVLGALSLGCKVFSTSGSFRQIKDQLNPALHAYASRFPQYEFLENRIVTRDPNAFFHGFATNDAGRFEGQHGDAKHPLVILVDEAKTVKDPVFAAVDRCRPPRQHCLIVVVSSAGYAGGEFHALNSTIKRNTLSHPPVVQRSSDCPHISAAEIDADRKKWGPEHPLVKSMHDAEFMGYVQGAIVQVLALDMLLANPPVYEPGERKAFCDFAWSESASGDESVLALRDGNRLTLPLCCRERGLHATAARFAAKFGELGLRGWEIEGDADGEGIHIIKELRKMGWAIGECHNGGAPRWQQQLYHNLAAEMWCQGAMDIVNGKWILPVDSDLYAQMINRKIVPNNKGLLSIESKQAMKDPNREGGSVPCSPDRADALFGAMAPLPINRPIPVMGGRERPADRGKDIAGSAIEDIWPEEREESHGGMPGAWAG